MSRIAIPSIDEVPAESRPVLDKVHETLGFVPNLQRLMALSPAVLNGWAALMGSLSKTLDVKTRDGVALAVSQADGCNYCLAAHSYVAHNLAKVPSREILMNREARSDDPKKQAALTFSKALIEGRGKVSDAEFNALRKVGFTDANILEIVALTAQFMLTNFVNNAIQTEIDFPALELARAE